MTDLPLPAPAILFVDDEATAVKYFERAIGSLAPVITANSVEEGIRMLDAHAGSISVLISDQRMPGAYGNELLFYAREHYPHIVRILTTAYSEIEHTVEAVNQGQIDRYIQKPWEITGLRMELQQALGLAALRKEHAELLREKLMIRQQQTVGNRIGTLYALCSGLIEPAHVLPLAAYLGIASRAGVTAPEPRWLLMDYCELLGAEAIRSAAFGRAVRDQLAQMERDCPEPAPELAMAQLARVLGPTLEPAAGGCIFLDGRQLTEFLETPCEAHVSQQHAAWLASLLWLARRGWSAEMVPAEAGLRVRLAPSGQALTLSQLAAWIDRFQAQPGA
ncbi:MAG: response regulator [Telluria sp.]|nr:response regulator [Telluria sp.]